MLANTAVLFGASVGTIYGAGARMRTCGPNDYRGRYVLPCENHTGNGPLGRRVWQIVEFGTVGAVAAVALKAIYEVAKEAYLIGPEAALKTVSAVVPIPVLLGLSIVAIVALMILMRRQAAAASRI